MPVISTLFNAFNPIDRIHEMYTLYWIHGVFKIPPKKDEYCEKKIFIETALNIITVFTYVLIGHAKIANI